MIGKMTKNREEKPRAAGLLCNSLPVLFIESLVGTGERCQRE